LPEKAAEEAFGCLCVPLAFDGVVEFVTVFFPVARFGYPWEAGVEGGFDQAVLPVFECGIEGIVEFIVGQLVDTVAAGTEEFGGVINDNHDWRFSRTAAMTFFSMGEWLSARARSTTTKAES